MKITIVKPDNVVGIDGEFFPVDLSALPENLRVIQWGGSSGHIEWADQGNTNIFTVNDYQSIIDSWQAVKDAYVAAQYVPTTEKNAAKARAAQMKMINAYQLNQAKKALGLTVDGPDILDVSAYVQGLETDISNPSDDELYGPPLPPGVTPPAVAAIIATITREPGWNSVLGWRIVLDISDPEYIPANIAISVYSSENCTGYLYTPGALQLDAETGKYFAVCPPGQEHGDVDYHFGLLYGAAQLSCWTLTVGEQEKVLQIYG
jgi:hypothetical protein